MGGREGRLGGQRQWQLRRDEADKTKMNRRKQNGSASDTRVVEQLRLTGRALDPREHRRAPSLRRDQFPDAVWLASTFEGCRFWQTGGEIALGLLLQGRVKDRRRRPALF